MPDKILDALIEQPGSEAAVTVVALADDDVAPRGASWQEMADNRWALLGTLFFVTAALGIPILWKSRAFSTPAKVTITFAVLAWTSLLFWIFWLGMLWSYNRIAASLN